MNSDLNSAEFVGQQLRQARETQELSLEQIASATFIKLRYLKALEAGELQTLPSKTQARGFLRAYASFLKLDPTPLLAALEGNEAPTAELVNSTRQKDQPTPSTAQVNKNNLDQTALAGQAQEIFNEIGKRLQHRRELLGLSIADIERHTKLRSRYLTALEAGDLNNLPSPVQGRGMLDNYAVFLGLDPEPLLLRFADGLQARLAAHQVQQVGTADQRSSRQTSDKPGTPARQDMRPKKAPPIQRLLSGDVLFGVFVAIFLVIFSIWGVFRILALGSQAEPQPTAPSIAEVLLATSIPAPSETPTPTRANQPAIAPISEATSDQTSEPLASSENVVIYLTVLQRALVNVTVDGEVKLSERVFPGSAFTFEGKDKIEILTSNGAGLQILYNGQDQGLMGLFGQVVYRIYTTQGILTPTPTITATPTPTQVIPSTPTPTQTVSPNLPVAPTRPPLP